MDKSIDDKVNNAQALNVKYYKLGWYNLKQYHRYNIMINDDAEFGIVKIKYDIMKERVRLYNNEKKWNNWW